MLRLRRARHLAAGGAAVRRVRPGDPLFSVWRLMWVTHEFVRNPLNIFNGNQFYPEPRTLTFSDPVLTPTLLFAPLHAIGLHRLVAYNIVFLSGGVFSGVRIYYLARALTGRRDAAWVGAAIFAMYPYRVEHFAHLELQMTMWMPIALWYLHRTLASGRLRDGLGNRRGFRRAVPVGALLRNVSHSISVRRSAAVSGSLVDVRWSRCARLPQAPWCLP